MTDPWKLLREARMAIDCGVTDEKYRLDIVSKIDIALAEHEAAPERKCGTCKFWDRENVGSFDGWAMCTNWRGRHGPDWFCADWQPKETP